MAADLGGHAFEFFNATGRGIRVDPTQLGGKQVSAAEDVQRQVAVTAVIAMLFLGNSSVELGGARFLGTMLWSDFALFAPDLEDDAMVAAEQCMSAYRVISVARDGLTKVPLSAYETLRIFEKSSAWIERSLAEPFGGPSVVVTYHLLSHNSASIHLRG